MKLFSGPDTSSRAGTLRGALLIGEDVDFANEGSLVGTPVSDNVRFVGDICGEIHLRSTVRSVLT